MPALPIGYARVSANARDLRAQQQALAELGVDPERTYTDRGLRGTSHDRPALREALAACRAGDTLVVTRLERLARSLPDAQKILSELAVRQTRLSLGGHEYDLSRPLGQPLPSVLEMVAAFEAGLAQMRTSEGMKIARAKGRLRGKPPKLSPLQEAHLVELYRSGEHTIADILELFPTITRSTVYRALHRAGGPDPPRSRSR